MRIASQVYKVGIRKRNGTYLFEDTSLLKKFKILRSSILYCFADPFLFEHNNVHYLFLERINKITRKGQIVFSIIRDKDGKVSRPHPVIKTKFHMSFPNITIINGQIVMIPETCEEKCVAIYSFDNFPCGCKKQIEILTNVRHVDSILYNNYLLSYCIEEQFNPSLHLYKKGDNGLYSLTNRFVDSDDTKRCAGKIFNLNNDVIFPSQIGFPNYGYGLCFYKISMLKGCITFNNYRSITAADVFRILKKKVNGIHTYNIDSVYEVIDLDFSMLSFFGLIGRILRRFCKKKNK